MYGKAIQPSDLDAEKQMLSCLISQETGYFQAADILQQEHFYDDLHAEIYLKIKQIYSESPEKTTQEKFLDLRKNFIGDVLKYVVSLENSFNKLINIRDIAEHLAGLHTRREIIKSCQWLAELAENEADIKKLNGATRDTLSQICDREVGIVGKERTQLQQEIYDIVSGATKNQQFTTGYRILDVATDGGFEAGRLYVFAAKAKMGKTLFTSAISNHLNEIDVPHAFICAEMGSREIYQRMLGQNLGVMTSSLRRAGSQEFANKIATIREKNNTVFVDEPGIDFDRLKAVVESLIFRRKIKCFILDYYQLVSGGNWRISKAEHLEEVGNWIHRICKRHQVFSIIVSQLNDDDKTLGSRGINRSCDQYYIINRDEKTEDMWLNLEHSRYTSIPKDIESRFFRIHQNGTHFEEL